MGRSEAAENLYYLSEKEGGASLPPGEASLICSNRALSLLRCKRAPEAAEAAAQALEYDPTNAKAAFRHAQALSEDPAALPKALSKAVASAETAVRPSQRIPKQLSFLKRSGADSRRQRSVGRFMKRGQCLMAWIELTFTWPLATQTRGGESICMIATDIYFGAFCHALT